MKTSMKILAASVALTALTMSGAANASIAISTQNSGSGELFLTAWDQAGLQSYSRDLGVFESDMVANLNQTLSYNLNTLDTGAPDKNWATFINSGSKGVGVVYTITGDNISDIITPQAYGFVTTSPSTIATFQPSVDTISKLTNTSQSINTWAGYLNTDANDVLLTTTGSNLSTYAAAGDTSKIAYFDQPIWSINAGDKTFLTIGNIDQNIAFYTVLVNQTTYATEVTKQRNVWKLDTNGQLTYSAVPVPAALWLFGSGLLGMAGISRRRKA